MHTTRRHQALVLALLLDRCPWVSYEMVMTPPTGVYDTIKARGQTEGLILVLPLPACCLGRQLQLSVSHLHRGAGNSPHLRRWRL